MLRPTRTGFVAIICTCACALALAGCGHPDGLGKRYRITGKVAYKDQPVKRAMILFSPADEGLSASSPVTDGVYRNLTTRTDGDGILPGKYRVVLFPYSQPDPSPSPSEKDREPSSSSLGRVYTTSGLPLPEKYLNLSTSGLEVVVTPATFAFDFDLGLLD